MGIKDMLSSSRKSVDESSNETSTRNSLPTGKGPGTTGLDAAVSHPKGRTTSGDSVGAGAATSDGSLPPGKGPGTTGIDADTSRSTTGSHSADRSGSIGRDSERSLRNENDRSLGSGGIGAAGAGAGVAGAGIAGANAGRQSGQEREGVPSSNIGHHKMGHSLKDAHVPDVDKAEHDQKHLQHVTHENVRHQEVEEVERQRELHRHVHHVQHHVQPVVDKEVKDEVHHSLVHPVTNISEKHESTDDDSTKFAALNVHKNEQQHMATERTIVDLGEKVDENVHHHVHHVIQPIIEKETVDRHRIHTVIPTKHVAHEAPIVHKSTTHEPVSKEDFLSKGGKLGSGLSHDKAGVLNVGDCSREVDGVGERLAEDLHLGKSSNYNDSYSTPQTGSTQQTGSTRQTGI